AALRRAIVGLPCQAYNRGPVRTAYENAEFARLLRGVPAAERRRIVEPLLARLGLGDLMDRRPHQLSGGQQQRVAIARALATGPRIVLADEPTANLDSASSEVLLDHMLELNRDLGTTLLFSSHDDDVLSRVRRIVYMRDGRVDHEVPAGAAS